MYHRVMQIRHGSSSGLGKSQSAAKSGAKEVIRRNSAKRAEPAGKPIASEAGSIVIFALAIFLTAALLTYWPTDPSFFSNSTSAAHNACGKVGAFLSSLFLECFGIGAFLTPAALFFLAATVFKREGTTRFLGTLGGMTVAVMSFTVFLTLQWKYWPYAGSLLLTGGAFGAWLAEVLIRQFNPLGSSIVSLVIFCLAVVISTPVSIARAAAFLMRHVGRYSWHLFRLAGTYIAYAVGLLAMRGAHKAGDFLQKLIEGAIRRTRERAQAMREAAAEAKEVAALVGPAEAGRESDDSEDSDDKDAALEAALPALTDGRAAQTMGRESRAATGRADAEAMVALADSDDAEVNGADEDAGDDADIDSHLPASPSIAKAAAKAATLAGKDKSSLVLGATANSEAPNVLPELEAGLKESARKSAGELHSGAVSAAFDVSPAILPPESSAVAGSPPTTEEEARKLKDSAAKALARLAKLRSRTTNWKLPSLEFLKKVPKTDTSFDRERLKQNALILKQKFADFGIEGDVTGVRPGPVITLYEFKPGPGIKVSRIAALADDLSMALSAQSVRILAPLPGKSVVGIEIPSDNRETVYMREFLQHPDFFGPKHSIPVVMGKDIGGQPYLSDLAKMPHLLCAGQTGAGKSVFMNGLICSLFYRFTPDELRMILVDPKFIEFRAYQDMPHLLLPVVDDPKHACTALKWSVREMERRYRILAMMGARNLAAFNQKVDEMGADVVQDLLMAEENQPAGLETMKGGDWIDSFDPDDNGQPRIGKLPYIVIIIDELADLMMDAKKDVEFSITKIAQKARAAGIHLVIATQRPSTDVVTGLIKANLPSRVSFKLASFIDSKTILDRAGAERLLGQGDMLFTSPTDSSLLRLQGAYLSDDEINKVAAYLKSQGKPVYRSEILVDDSEEEEPDHGESKDELFDEAVELVRRTGQASASFLQRHLEVGYNRAARLIETMEGRGIVGPPNGAKPREVLMRSP